MIDTQKQKPPERHTHWPKHNDPKLAVCNSVRGVYEALRMASEPGAVSCERCKRIVEREGAT
jgi:hypothetical protein